MKIKRIVIFTLAGKGVALLCYLAVCVKFNAELFEIEDWLLKEKFVICLINFISIVLCTTCQLAVVDFLFCLGEKKYSKSMLIIAMMLFVLFILFTAMSVVFCIEIFAKIYSFGQYLGFYVWVILTSAPILGLAIAYAAVKRKFILSTSQRKKSTQQNEE